MCTVGKQSLRVLLEFLVRLSETQAGSDGEEI